MEVITTTIISDNGKKISMNGNGTMDLKYQAHTYEESPPDSSLPSPGTDPRIYLLMSLAEGPEKRPLYFGGTN